jgi:hypothetical protein
MKGLKELIFSISPEIALSYKGHLSRSVEEYWSLLVSISKSLIVYLGLDVSS